MTPADSLRAVLDRVFAEPAYHWVERPGPLAFLGRWLRALGRWLADLEGRHPTLFSLFVWALVLILAAIVLHGLVVWLRTSRRAVPGPAAEAAGTPRRSPAVLRREADALAAAGRYAEAMQRDFLALVLDLDARDLVRFQAGKTPAEYSGESRLDGAGRADLRELVRALYAVAFARVPCGAGEFADWRARMTGLLRAPA